VEWLLTITGLRIEIEYLACKGRLLFLKTRRDVIRHFVNLIFYTDVHIGALFLDVRGLTNSPIRQSLPDNASRDL
jgi:hypothetical protein